MWLVVYKHEYYPSVYEFDNETEANGKYKVLKEQLNDLYENEPKIDGHRLYICEIKNVYGENTDDVDWY